jgi:DNA-binding winged helix-turn-helix (wHTH) protein/Flp pilus assembly protein TadD
MDKETKHFYEFGPFRIDPEKLLLLRDNEIVALPPKAFETLLVLVRHSVCHSETVVLKDDLMKSVWPDTFVEESNLAQNIFVLRKTLGETAGQNRYIATVPGRGYRFAEKVRLVPEQKKEEEIVLQSRSITHVVIDERSSSSQMWRWAGAAALVLAALGGAWLWRSYKVPRLTNKDTVVLADFANTTGDSVFDGTLRQGLSAQLEQSPFLNLLSDRRTGQTLALMGQPKDARLTHELAQEVCQRAAAAAVLDGSIAQIGGRYLLTLRALDCKSGETLASAAAEANDRSQVLEALGKIASETRGKLGESLASVQKYDVPPQEVSTPSLEALHSYSLAMKVRNGDFATCIPLFRRAIEQDPNFAMAYAQLGVVYINIGETVRGVENLRKAYELRERVSEREKFYIASHYDSLVTGDLEAARKDSELWAQIYPRDPGASGNLAVIYYYLGDFEKLLATVQESSDLAGTKASPNLDWCFIFLNRLDEAKAMALQAQTLHVDDPLYHLNLYTIDFLRRDFAGTKHEAAGLVGNPTWGDAVFYFEAATAGYFGQFIQAREFSRRAADFAEKADKKQSAAIYLADAAIREALAGNSALAREQAKSALAISRGKDVEAMSAIALSLAGDSAKAMQLVSDLDKRFPQDTITQFNHLPTIRSAVELQNGNAAKAIQTLAAASPYELGITALDAGMSLYPVYMRGEAYLAAKQGSAAAAEFQKILDHPGVVQNELIGALAYLGQGRAYTLSGDTNRAHAAYQEFFALWKDADPNIPILREAKTEYAKLQ